MSPAVLCLLLAVAAPPVAEPVARSQAAAPEKWRSEMAKFDAADRETPTAPGGIVFTGSSSIRLWDLNKSFPELKPLNRGFGGSQMDDVRRNVDRLILRHKPRVVVIYSGDNDLANGHTPEQVADDFRAITTAVRRELPETKIVLIPPKPSVKRWNLADEIRRTNILLAAICKQTPHCEFVDAGPLLLGDDGTPRPELFREDGLHLNEQGYALWTAKVAPLLE